MRYGIIHIPKTGGTFLREVLQQAVGTFPTYYYKWNIPHNNNMIVMGHFTYKFIKETDPSLRLATVVRDPVEHVVSNYKHYVNYPLTEFEPEIGRLPMGMSFDQFIDAYIMHNYQSKFITVKQLDSLALVGIQDELEGFIEQLGDMLDLSLNYHRPPSNKSNIQIEITESQRKRILKLNKEDMKLYKRAKEIWQQSQQ